MSDIHDAEDQLPESNSQDQHGEVGYKNPPVGTRFQKGRSGNPRGRPRKRPTVVTERQERAYFFEADKEPVWITENGKRKKLAGMVALYRVLRAKALQGDYRSAKLVIELRQQFIEEALTTQARLAETTIGIKKYLKATGEAPSPELEALLDEAEFKIENPI